MLFVTKLSSFLVIAVSIVHCNKQKSDDTTDSVKTYLDKTFGTKGQTTADFSASRDHIYSLKIQSDGKIVAVGTSTDANLNGQGFSLARFTADGALDTTFATTGTTNTATITQGLSYAAEILSTGNILVAGSAYPVGQNRRFALASYKADGTIDTNFSSVGYVTTSISGSTASTDEALAMGQISTTSSVVLAGYTDFLGTVKFALAKYQSDGSLESGFGTGGIVTTAFSGGSAKIFAIKVLSDGKIVAAGEASNGTDTDFAVAKYNSDGSLDTSFDSDGTLLVDIDGKDDTALDLTIDSTGQITLAGLSHTSEAQYDLALIRLSATGALDTTFGTLGKTTSSLLGSKVYAGIKAPLVKVSPTSDGASLLVTGPATTDTGIHFGLLKFSAAGQVDTSFATSGKMAFEWKKGTDHSSSSSALAIDSQGRVLLGGYFYIDQSQDFALARFAF